MSAIIAAKGILDSHKLGDPYRLQAVLLLQAKKGTREMRIAEQVLKNRKEVTSGEINP